VNLVVYVGGEYSRLFPLKKKPLWLNYSFCLIMGQISVCL